MSDQFEPRLIGFLCRWCSYNGADLAGTSRMKYPPNMVPIKTNCSGRVDPMHILKAFQEGADGVLIAGCHPGDCHYINGNYRTAGRFPLRREAARADGPRARPRAPRVGLGRRGREVRSAW